MIKEGDSINNELLEFIKECIKNNNMHSFYIKKVWREKRKEIIQRDHCECQACKRKGKIKVLKIKTNDKSKRAYVHHIKHLKDYPELALDNDNLETLCFYCHEEEHTEERKRYVKTKEHYTNDEKW